MSDIGPGTMLVCVGELNPAWSINGPKIGVVYECAGFGTEGACGDCGTCRGIHLRDLAHPAMVNGRIITGFCPRLFVPAGRKGQFNELLKARWIKESPYEIIEAAYVRLGTNT